MKTSLAPGSRVVTDYLHKPGWTSRWSSWVSTLVGYGCTTCIGNSGPLPEPVANAVTEGNLVAAAVLSGNRNFEGRINPLVKANYLASPPLVVAYALAGTTDIDLTTEPLGQRTATGRPVYSEGHLARRRTKSTRRSARPCGPRCSAPATASVFDANPKWNALPVRRRRAVRLERGQHVHPGAAVSGRSGRRSPARSSRSAAPGCCGAWAIR